MTKAKESNKLHELIHKISKSDKAYLKKYSKIFIPKGETKQKTYYFILEKMKNYSLEELKNKLDKKGGYRRFKNTEHELYNQMLEDLVILKSKKRPTWQYWIEHMKTGYLFLDNDFEGSLKHYDTMYRIKEESKNLTIDYMYHKFYYHTLAYVQNTRNEYDAEKLKNVEDNLRQSIDDLKLEFLIEAAIHNFDILRLSAYNKTRIQFLKDIKLFEVEYVDVLPKTLETVKFKILATYYYFFCNYYLITGNLEELGNYSGSYYEKYNTVEMKDNFSHEYANALYFRIEYLAKKNDKRAYQLIEEKKQFIEGDNFYGLKSFFHLMYCQEALLVYTHFQDTKSIEELIINEKEKYLQETKNAKNRMVLATEMYWALGLFQLKRYKESQPFLDKIFDTFGNINERFNKILVLAKILDIMIHFELKNYENIKYYIDNLEKEMKRNNQLIAFDKEFFRLLRKLNQQLFSKQKPDKKEFLDFLELKKDEDRLNSYMPFLNIKNWLNNI